MSDLRHTRRLFIDIDLAAGFAITPSGEHAHYLLNVLRLKEAEVMRVFNGRNGEWSAHVTSVKKRSLLLQVDQQLRTQTTTRDLWLCAAPLKKAHFDFMVEKATELGVSVIQPILTSRTQVREVNTDRLRLLAIEAAEQSERLSIPTIREPMALDKLVTSISLAQELIVCAEWGDAKPIAEGLSRTKNNSAIILTGPEGGFTTEEFTMLRHIRDAVFVRLGPRILRADTAALAALSCWQAAKGDWR